VRTSKKLDALRLSSRIADGSLRTLGWQEKAYAEQMGEEKAERQTQAGRARLGLCTCPNGRGVTIKTHGVFRTIHPLRCPRYRKWMDEYLEVAFGSGRWPQRPGNERR
jgi:hypothetical protein